MTSLTLQDIRNAENAIKGVRDVLQSIGREIYKLREGQKLGPEYTFERYSIEEFAGVNYAGQEGPNWPVGTPIFSLTYYWSRAEDVIYITFPVGWLEQDWRALEQARLDEERAAEAARKRADAATRHMKQEEDERRNYERLKAKFEESRHD